MKKFLSFIILIVLQYEVTGQNLDRIIKIKGDTLNVNIQSVNETSVTFMYPNEKVSQSINKKGIQQILYSSGRMETISIPIIVNGEEAWEKVILTTNPSDIEGLTKLGSVEGKAKKLGGGQNKLTEKANVLIKKEAAKLKAFIILIQSSTFAESPINNVLVTGFAYGY